LRSYEIPVILSSFFLWEICDFIYGKPVEDAARNEENGSFSQDDVIFMGFPRKSMMMGFKFPLFHQPEREKHLFGNLFGCPWGSYLMNV
jgi:hypothetical protein